MSKRTVKKAKSVRGAHETMVSVPAYAKSRGVTDQAIRKRIKSGELIPAMAGGKINVIKANRILNDGTTVGDNIGTELVAARRRKLVAKARTLRTEVEAIRANVVQKDIAEKILNAETARVRDAIMAIPDQIDFSDDLAGHSSAVFGIIDKKVREVLTRLGEQDQPSSDETSDQPDLNAMTPVELTTLLNNLKADQIEIDALLLSGEAVRMDETDDRFDDKLLRVRGRLLAVAGRVASTGDASPSKLKAKLRRALSEALEAFAKEPDPEEDEIE